MSTELIGWLRQHDRRLFASSSTFESAYKEFGDGSVPLKQFKESAREHCEWWKVAIRMKPKRQSVQHLESGWDHLRQVVLEMADELRGQEVWVCSEMLRTRIPCNPTILEALPRGCHVWEVPGR